MEESKTSYEKVCKEWDQLCTTFVDLAKERGSTQRGASVLRESVTKLESESSAPTNSAAVLAERDSYRVL